MPFDFLHHLMDVAVQHRHGAEPLQVRQRPRAVVGAPAPLGIHRPQRNVGEDDDRRAALETLDVLLEPLELFVAERAETAGLQVDDVHEADEVHAVLVEAVPAGALRAFAESLQVALAVVLEHVVFAGDVEHRQRQLAPAPAAACRTRPASTGA